MSTPLKILVFGAHPDDCEIKFGGTAALYARAGHHVRFVSVTNGNTGHHEIGGVELAKIRAQEAANSAATVDIEYVIMDIQSNELEPSLPYRKRIIEMIREFEPDMVATHRPCDYHPDHRLLRGDCARRLPIDAASAEEPCDCLPFGSFSGAAPFSGKGGCRYRFGY
jgi:LmbE family N-acetylglucosaminyl deacetylase